MPFGRATASVRDSTVMITWTPIEEYVQPNFDLPESKQYPTLFWADGVGPVLGHLKDGEFWSEDWEETYEIRPTWYCRVRPPQQRPV